MTAIGTNANSSQAFISLSCYLNPQGSSSQQNILAYRSADTLTAAPPSLLTVIVPVSTTSSFDLAALFSASTAPIFVGVAEVAAASAGLGFKIKVGTSGTQMGVIPNGFFAYLADGVTTLPVVYISNASSSTELVVTISVLTQ